MPLKHGNLSVEFELKSKIQKIRRLQGVLRRVSAPGGNFVNKVIGRGFGAIAVGCDGIELKAKESPASSVSSRGLCVLF